MELKPGKNPFTEARLKERPLILDGAIGTLLQQRDVPVEGIMWMSLANINQPDKVLQVHKDYIEAGADIITTNTFRTNPSAIQFHSKVDIRTLVKRSVEIAKEAVGNLPVWIAGSNAPAEDCYQVEREIMFNELEKNHKQHIDLLYENGCNFILNETQSHFDEIQIICEHCAENNIPYVISLFIDENLNLLSGERINEAFDFILDKNPLAIGINCVLPPTFMQLFKNNDLNFNWGVYMNCGDGSFTDKEISCGISPEEYEITVQKLLVKNPSFIGACCGSIPEHIHHIKQIVDEKINS